tara:strand:- start:54 stop:473 length:420 start_codon:yes stop_codon:yes gene_type:complete
MIDETPEQFAKRKEKNGYKNGTKVGSLATQVKHAPLWPTPTIDSATERTKKYSQGGTPLTMAVKMWPTARASEYKTVPKNRYWGSETYRGNLGEAVRTSEEDGHLNPTWVEWLMGFPLGHTELKHWVTRSSRKSQKQSD